VFIVFGAGAYIISVKYDNAVRSISVLYCNTISDRNIAQPLYMVKQSNAINDKTSLALGKQFL